MHMCCGYPGHVDQTDYVKADNQAYRRIAPALDASSIDAVSIEDAWCKNDLSLLSLFKRTKVILGSMNVSSSRVESVEEIQARLSEALQYIEPERLIVAPDCGLGLLQNTVTLKQKLKNMCAAARSVPTKTVDLSTTVIGSYPKPAYLKLPDVFQSNEAKQKKGLIADEEVIKEMNKIFKAQTPESQAMLEADIMEATE